jgi:opacity protein-like surface antigen
MTTSANAQIDGPFWYAGLHGGAYHVTETEFGNDISDLFLLFPVEGARTTLTFEQEYDIGYAIGAVLGRQLTPWFGVEGEYTLRKADFDENQEFIDGTESHAFFGNLMFRWPTSKPIEIYGGIGAGFVATNYVVLETLVDDEGNSSLGEKNLSDPWGLQVKGGLDWFITDRDSLGLEAGYHKTRNARAELEDGVDAIYELGGVSLQFTAKTRF